MVCPFLTPAITFLSFLWAYGVDGLQLPVLSCCVSFLGESKRTPTDSFSLPPFPGHLSSSVIYLIHRLSMIVYHFFLSFLFISSIYQLSCLSSISVYLSIIMIYRRLVNSPDPGFLMPIISNTDGAKTFVTESLSQSAPHLTG